MPNVPTDRANSGEMQRKLKNKSLTQRISYNLPQRAGGVKKKMRHRAEEYSGQVSHKLWGLAALVTSVIAIPVSTAFIATHRIKEAEDSSFRKCQRKRERISNGIFQVFFFFMQPLLVEVVADQVIRSLAYISCRVPEDTRIKKKRNCK